MSGLAEQRGGSLAALCDAVRAEWTKFRTVRAMPWFAAAAVLLTIGLGALADHAVTCPAGGCAVDPVKVGFTGIMLGQALVATMAVLAIGAEYSSGLIRTSLTAIPQRLIGFAGRTIVLGAVALAVAVASVAGSLAAQRLLLPGRGFTAANHSALPPPTDPALLRATLCAVLYLVLIALLSLGIAHLTRDSVAALGIVLALLYLFPIVAQVIRNPAWHQRLERLGPMTAGLAAQTTTDVAAQPITPWHGIGVDALWALGALLAAAVVFKRRDA